MGWLSRRKCCSALEPILLGAVEFVDQVILFSQHAGLNPGALSLILSPLATELPEKYNSVVWIRQSKDHLALANITGAMVFQVVHPGRPRPRLHAMGSVRAGAARGDDRARVGGDPVHQSARLGARHPDADDWRRSIRDLPLSGLAWLGVL